MRKGYLTPPVLVILALITFFVAIMLYINAYFAKSAKNKTLPSPSPTVQKQSSPTPDASREPNGSTETATWKTYTNQTYNFQLQYPKDWLLEEDNKTENYYDAVVKIISAEGVISITTIHGIDIYQSLSVFDVAKREIMDSGFEYTTEETKIGNLTAAITKVEDSKKTMKTTIAHPNKNLFVEISYTGNKKILDQILSTFRFD